MHRNKRPDGCNESRGPVLFRARCLRNRRVLSRCSGFTFNQFFGEPPSFTIVERDDVRIIFGQVRPVKGAAARPNRSVMDGTFDAYIYVSDVDVLATELRNKKADIVEGPINRIYRMRDCNGYVLAFGQG